MGAVLEYEILIVEVYDILLMTLFVWASLNYNLLLVVHQVWHHSVVVALHSLICICPSFRILHWLCLYKSDTSNICICPSFSILHWLCLCRCVIYIDIKGWCMGIFFSERFIVMVCM